MVRNKKRGQGLSWNPQVVRKKGRRRRGGGGRGKANSPLLRTILSLSHLRRLSEVNDVRRSCSLMGESLKKRIESDREIGVIGGLD